MRIAIIGAGAMGCLYATLLAGQNEVTLYDAIPTVVDAINRGGIVCRQPDGTEQTFRLPAHLAGDCAGDYDLAILFVKDLFSRTALETNKAVIGAHTLLLSLQNGMGNEEIMRDYAAPERILLGTTKHNCVTLTPGLIYHSGAGITHIGSPVGNRAAAEQIVALFRASGADADVCDSVKHLLWEKLFVNMTINPLTALLNAHIGALAADENLRALSRTLIEEAVRVAAADGEVFDADLTFSHLMDTASALTTGKASMCQDIEKKHRTEIDFINGAVVRLGQKYGIPTPCHDMIVRLIHAKENLQQQ